MQQKARVYLQEYDELRPHLSSSKVVFVSSLGGQKGNYSQSFTERTIRIYEAITGTSKLFFYVGRP